MAKEPDEWTPRVARTGSPVERAMVAAENALHVPLEKGPPIPTAGENVRWDEARFRVLEFVAEAMAALDEVSAYDDITRDLVREKIGRAQERVGW